MRVLLFVSLTPFPVRMTTVGSPAPCASTKTFADVSAETLKLTVGAVFVADLRKQPIAVGAVLNSNVPSVT